MNRCKAVGAILELKKLHELGGDIKEIEKIMLQEDNGLYYRIKKDEFEKYKSMLQDSLLSFSFSTPKIKPWEIIGKGDLCAKKIHKCNDVRVYAFSIQDLSVGVFYEAPRC